MANEDLPTIFYRNTNMNLRRTFPFFPIDTLAALSYVSFAQKGILRNEN
jgi:hypothetical protein